ncbi:MFS transporter [Reyranella sp.]|uniref:MFS transporter n=1 Tax=Reyranella sp. TaxID=1929291 RepID=UPI003F714C20
MSIGDPDRAETKTATTAAVPSGRWMLARWAIASSTLGFPQAAGPVAFALVAVALTGDASGGAAMILAMTLAQVAGAIPLTRLGRGFAMATFLRLLVAVRTVALLAIATGAASGVSLAWLIALAAGAGLVNGAAYGYLRAVLNRLAPASGLSRALGIAATLNELTFVAAPVVASGLGSISPVFGIVAMAALGALPALLVPNLGPAAAASGEGAGEAPHREAGSILRPAILLWLLCAAAGGATVAAIEIGAVALALNFGYQPALAILFTVPLCIASVAGGLWVSVRNRRAPRGVVVAQLVVMSAGAALAATCLSVATTLAGAILIGLVLAPLATHYSLILDSLAPPHRRPEVFALLRTANASGVILASALLTAVSLPAALLAIAAVMMLATVAVGIASAKRREPVPPSRE